MQSALTFIAGSSRSGSTLLELLLNNHPNVLSVGEMHRLNSDARTDLDPCTCGMRITDCPFWAQVEAVVRERLGWPMERSPLLETEIMLVPDRVHNVGTLIQKTALLLPADSFARWANRKFAPAHEEILQQTLLWHQSLREVSGAKIIVDSTKDVRRMKLLYLAKRERFRLIYLIRDGRAVTAAEIRRRNLTMEEAATAWRRIHRQTQLAMWSIPRDLIFRVKYENLCADPEGVLAGICSFLRIDFIPKMVELRKTESHSIGGNPMRFRRDEIKIKLDEGWRQKLTEDQLRVFDRIAGRMNEKLGYDRDRPRAH